MTNTIEAVVFDFGGVIISPITRTISTVAADLGIEDETFLTLIMGPFHESTDHPWHRVERGELDQEDLQAHVEVLAVEKGLDLRGDELERIMAEDAYQVRTEILERIGRLREEGYQTGLLTNSTAAFRPTLEQIVPRELFDVYIDSSVVGMRKPEPRIFTYLLEALGNPPPDAVLYLDDFPGNLAGATAAGLQTIHVTSAEQALHDLDAALRGPSSRKR